MTLWPVLFAAAVVSAAPLPKDVEAFVEKRRGCDHWRGESSDLSERRAQIVAGINQACVGTDRELALLKEKYRSSKEIRKLLNEYESKIERKGAP
jgi:hypothetical protein